MSSLAYTHPDTHPASMITGLSDYLTTLGYGLVTAGSYSGTSSSSDRTITLPFSPTLVVIMWINQTSNASYDCPMFGWVMQGESGVYVNSGTASGWITAATLTDNNLVINSRYGGAINKSGKIYYWFELK